MIKSQHIGKGMRNLQPFCRSNSRYTYSGRVFQIKENKYSCWTYKPWFRYVDKTYINWCCSWLSIRPSYFRAELIYVNFLWVGSWITLLQDFLVFLSCLKYVTTFRAPSRFSHKSVIWWRFEGTRYLHFHLLNHVVSHFRRSKCSYKNCTHQVELYS
jgi:hypothetical protein